MPIVCKWSILGNQNEATFNTIEEMVSHEMYKHFNFIDMNKCGITEMPELPQNLQILKFNDNKIFKLPKLPDTLHSLMGENNRISEFPDVTHCFLLEDIDLSGNDIVELNTAIPSNIQTINIDFNRLRVINYELITPGVKISAAYNFLKQVPPQTHIRNIKFDHNDINDHKFRLVAGDCDTLDIPGIPTRHIEGLNGWDGANNYALTRRNNFGYTPIPKTDRIVGTDRQSVHHTSIQKSADKSLNYVLAYKPKTELPINFVDYVEDAYYNNKIKKSSLRRCIKYLSKSLAKRAIFPPPIRKWCDANDIHSQFGVTYKSLLKQVWVIIQEHEHRIAIEEVLFQEMDDSKYVCFTGRFTRTLNALTGFIEQVQIGIDSREQMGNQIAMAVKRARDKFGADFQTDARANVKQILVEFEVPEVEQAAWLDAID
jgi:hypothetical protein